MSKIDDVVSSILSHKIDMYEQEEKLEKPHSHKKFTIGVLKETSDYDKRVPLTPEGVEALVDDGYDIIIEKDAGSAAYFSDMDYAESGALIAPDFKEVVFKSDILVRISHPTVDEIKAIPECRTIISNLYQAMPTAECLKLMMKQRITGVAIEHVNNQLGDPIRNSMFPLEGKAVMLLAAELLTNEHGGQGVLLGGIAGISPVEVVIIGSGIVTEHAAKLGTTLGAMVKVFSPSPDTLFNMKENIGQSLFTNMLHEKALMKAFKTADIVINSFDFKDTEKQFVFDESILSGLKKGAVVLDMSMESEEHIEGLTRKGVDKYLYEKYGITYRCVANIPSRIARTSSMALNNIIYNLIKQVTASSSFIHILKENKGLRDGVYILNGILTDAHLARKHNLSYHYKDINLLLAAF